MSPNPSRLDRSQWLLLAVVCAIGIALLVWRAMHAPAGVPFFADTDDAMRMTVVRDFLQGQGWYDLVNHRLNTPYGAEVHWSRLIDVPLAFLLGVFTELFGSSRALVVTGYVWPMLLLVVLLWLSARLTLTLVGREGVLPALVLPLLSPAITTEFTPGRVDHHSVVIILTLGVAWMGIEALRRPRLAIAGGLLAATALAIATEALPTIAAAILVAGLAWVIDPARRRAMLGFALAFAGGTLVHLALYRPPNRWLEQACDVLSPVYALAAIAVAVAFVAAATVPTPGRPWQRLLLLAVLGSAAIAVVALVYPQCLGGPYAEMDPWLQRNWLAGITEAKPWIASVIDLPAYSLAVGLPVLFGVLIVLYRLWRVAADRLQWGAMLVFLLTVALVMLLQIRGARLAVMPAMPAAAWLIVVARQRYLRRPGAFPAIGLLASWLAFAGILMSMAVAQVVTLVPGRAQTVAIARANKQTCLVPSAFADLATRPQTRIMAPIDLGSHLLLYTRHQVVAAPYHRAQQGVLDAFRFFNDPIEDARAILDRRGIGLVVICPGMPEVQGQRWRSDDSFASLYAADSLPDWLVDISAAGSPLKVYQVQR